MTARSGQRKTQQEVYEVTSVTTQPLFTPACDCDGNNSSPFQKNQWQQWQCPPELLQGSSPAVPTSHINHHLQFSVTDRFPLSSSSSGKGLSIFSAHTNIPPSSPGVGRVSVPSHDCLQGTAEFYPCDTCREGTSSFCHRQNSLQRSDWGRKHFSCLSAGHG